jgi:hypothetical protein
MFTQTFDFETTLSPEECQHRLNALTTPVGWERPITVVEVSSWQSRMHIYGFNIRHLRRTRRSYTLRAETHGHIASGANGNTRIFGQTKISLNALSVPLIFAVFNIIAVFWGKWNVFLIAVSLVATIVYGRMVYTDFKNSAEMVPRQLRRS